MPLLKDGRLVDDPWQRVGDDEPLPADAPALLSYARWRAEREALAGRNVPVGVRVPNTVDVGLLAPDLDRFGVIALEFPKFNDGRAYSQARLLRERYGYRGELRATGAVLRDQLVFMRRCGFDAFELVSRDPEAAWRAAMGEISVFYQPAG
jgi:uncharacterized protein (DUF934 family)